MHLASPFLFLERKDLEIKQLHHLLQKIRFSRLHIELRDYIVDAVLVGGSGERHERCTGIIIAETAEGEVLQADTRQHSPTKYE